MMSPTSIWYIVRSSFENVMQVEPLMFFNSFFIVSITSVCLVYIYCYTVIYIFDNNNIYIFVYKLLCVWLLLILRVIGLVIIID
jgi:hypothetical protein